MRPRFWEELESAADVSAAILISQSLHRYPSRWRRSCLKNEQETYEELNKKLPGIGDTVTLPDGIQGTVQSVNVLRQRVKVVVEVNDEKEIQEFPVDELKFRARRKKIKISDKEMKELEKLEDKEGDIKSHGKKSAD